MDNGTSGPITDLEVDVYAVDSNGKRSPDRCRPAKGNVSLRDLFRELLTDGLSGTLDAIGTRAQSIYSPMPWGMQGVPPQLGSYGGMMAAHAAHSPQLSQVLQWAQQQMLDRFPQVMRRGEAARVLFTADEEVEVRANIQFADEVGDLWRRRHGQLPEPVLEGE
ncbi:hypothetical protein [Rhodococcus rhodochrous]|uniref:hypothetical protein n=1 Tax=Rhodococcus rhodochrous TaxID=1829 RepID=UPI001E3D4840|nr:hypothetical protein [Rhodococcus rhodochrous]